MEFEIGDTVKIKGGGAEIYTVKQIRPGLYLIQLGTDGAAIQGKSRKN